MANDPHDNAAALEQQLEPIQAERARLITDQPDGWRARYAELGEQATALTRRWQDACEREWITAWWEGEPP